MKIFSKKTKLLIFELSLICIQIIIVILIHVIKNHLLRLILIPLLIIGLIFSIIYFISISKSINSINEQRKSQKFIELIDKINEDTSFNDILHHMFYSFREFIPYSHIGIALLKDNGEIIESSYGISDESLNGLANKLVGIKAHINETSLKKVIDEGKPRVINDLQSYINHPNKTYNKLLLEAGINSSITYPLILYNKPVGIIFFSSVYKNIYNDKHLLFLKNLSNSIAISLYKNLFIDELLYTQVLSLAKLAETRDEDTGLHLVRMQQYSVKLAELLYRDQIFPELTYSMIKDIEKFSPLHDIGKVGIRDEILLKPGKLTKEEYIEMQYHAIYGAQVLQYAENNMQKFNKSLFQVGIEIALGHHEKWDGTGYPYQKKGEEIPLSARIVAVADVFDALTSKRPYKEAYTFDESMEIIISGKGKHFDPRIIDCLIKYEKEFRQLYNSFHHA